jgi:UDP-N-acetylglucosamine transferase subunit ALG13
VTATPARTAVVFVTVGTDYHRFDRLMGWLETWQPGRSGLARLVVQHGSSRLPVGAEGFSMSSRDEVLEHIRRSDVVVTQGGPGGIMDSRYSGILPIAVPRRPDLEEVVDDHQIRFCRHLARQGLIKIAEKESELHAHLDSALRDPAQLRIDADTSHVAETVERIGGLIEGLVQSRPARAHSR